MPPRVLLAATINWPIAAQLARAFTKLGWSASVVGPGCRSSFVDTIYGYTAFAPLPCLRRAIVDADADLIVPCDDRAVTLLVQLHKEAEEAGEHDLARQTEHSIGAPENYPALMRRAGLIAIAKEKGIRVAPMRAVASPAELERGLVEFGLPAVLKTDGSWGGGGVRIVHTYDEAHAAFRDMSAPISNMRAIARSLRRRDAHHLAPLFDPTPQRISLQAHIVGVPATTSFSCWQGDVLASLHADVVVSSGGTGPASVVRLINDEAMEDAVRKLARRFGLSGLHGLDFVRDREGRVHLLEINPRATPLAALAMGEGRDVIAAIAARAATTAPVTRAATIAGDLVALFPQEWHRDPSSVWLQTAHHDVPWDDPVHLRACSAERRGPQLRAWLKIRRPAGETLPLPLGNHPAIASDG